LLLPLSILYDTSDDSLCSIHIFSLTLDCIFHTSKRVLSLPVPSQLLLSLYLSLSLSLSFILKLTVVTSPKYNESLYQRNKMRKEGSVKSSSMCVPYNERSNWGVYLVWQPINTLLYTIIFCRIRAKLLTATIEQNEGEKESKCCSHHPSYRLQIFLKAYFGLSYPSCHREFFLFLSSCYLIVQQRQQKKRRAVLMSLRLNAHYDHCYA
jgi:hypothetical protein